MLSAVLVSVLVTPPSPPADSVARATVRLDASRKEVVVTAGPFDVAAMPPGMKHEDMEMMEDHNTPVIRFEWPVEGWVRGFGVEILDAENRPVDRKLIHHLIGVNFDRRQLLYPAFERLFGIGQETEDAAIPKTIGVPLQPGTKLGMYMAWANETGVDLKGVRVVLRLFYSPTNLNPRPLDALPIYMDVNLTVGGTNTFDVPVGRSEKAYEFEMPIDGRLLGVAGHLHDHGVLVRLEDASTGRELTRVTATRGADGKVLKLSRRLHGVTGQGLRLEAGKRYRVVGVYENRTGATIPKGAMAHIVGLFAPDDVRRWPRLDLTDETLQEDLASLSAMGSGGGHKHHEEPPKPR
ncbi:MAG: hypothetical protein ACRENB_08900 [Gemmatimonadales bacterium]